MLSSRPNLCTSQLVLVRDSVVDPDPRRFHTDLALIDPDPVQEAMKSTKFTLFSLNAIFSEKKNLS
jgi:hypothetical protein